MRQLSQRPRTDQLLTTRFVPTKIEIFEDHDRGRQHLREMIDRPDMVDGFDDDDRGLAGEP